MPISVRLRELHIMWSCAVVCIKVPLSWNLDSLHHTNANANSSSNDSNTITNADRCDNSAISILDAVGHFNANSSFNTFRNAIANEPPINLHCGHEHQNQHQY